MSKNTSFNVLYSTLSTSDPRLISIMGIPKAPPATTFFKNKKRLIFVSNTRFLSSTGGNIRALSGGAKQRVQIWRLLKVLPARNALPLLVTLQTATTLGESRPILPIEGLNAHNFAPSFLSSPAHTPAKRSLHQHTPWRVIRNSKHMG